ncbi:uncharacterized protein LOC130680027 isoform X3 [Manis pentadactyla]|uniref:uncharacterized protein LOC130680027 isoform X3 n=1 Tax=Manis pentadactyla TaxID=143292 RepID=UPI00255C85BB|nr:uncharacterized protein LOC130680027 isoform X3 [Manis pentadactyla]
MVDRRCARLRLPPGAQAPVAPAIGPDMEPPPRPALRSSSSAASSLAPSYLLRSVQSGPRFRGEGDSDGSVGRKRSPEAPRGQKHIIDFLAGLSKAAAEQTWRSLILTKQDRSQGCLHQRKSPRNFQREQLWRETRRLC